MGELGRKLAGTGRGAALRILRRAYADEWFAHYNYQFTARTLRGHYSPAVLDAERTSLHTFDALYKAAQGKDPVTERLAQDLLVEMAAGEEEIEKLIGDPAPSMDGK